MQDNQNKEISLHDYVVHKMRNNKNKEKIIIVQCIEHKTTMYITDMSRWWSTGHCWAPQTCHWNLNGFLLHFRRPPATDKIMCAPYTRWLQADDFRAWQDRLFTGTKNTCYFKIYRQRRSDRNPRCLDSHRVRSQTCCCLSAAQAWKG